MTGQKKAIPLILRHQREFVVLMAELPATAHLHAGNQIARSTLLERRHLVQTYTWRGEPSTIAFTRFTLGAQVLLERL